jgi:hypothetical protein
VIIPFINMEVAIKAEKGPKAPALMSLRGNINKLMIKIPNGGIHILCKIEDVSVVPLHTY